MPAFESRRVRTHPRTVTSWSTVTRPWSTSATGTTLIIFSLLIVWKRSSFVRPQRGDTYVTWRAPSDKQNSQRKGGFRKLILSQREERDGGAHFINGANTHYSIITLISCLAFCIETIVLNDLMLPEAKNSSRVSISYSAISRTFITSRKSKSPVT